MKIVLSCIFICFSIACFSQVKADTFYVELKAVGDFDIENQPGCGIKVNTVIVPFFAQSDFGNTKKGEKIDLIIVCPELHRGLKNIVKNKKYIFKIYYQYERDEYGNWPGYYLD